MLPNAPCEDTPDSHDEQRPHVSFTMTWTWHLLYILYSLEVGVLLLFLPWLPLWENNYLVYLYPKLQPLVANPFFKGAVLGLGIVNILIGIQEIAYLRTKNRDGLSR